MNKNINNNVMFDLGPHVVEHVLFCNLFILIKYADYEKNVLHVILFRSDFFIFHF
jgi:hypothetical protein